MMEDFNINLEDLYTDKIIGNFMKKILDQIEKI